MIPNSALIESNKLKSASGNYHKIICTGAEFNNKAALIELRLLHNEDLNFFFRAHSLFFRILK
jgi:hypothetical protein